MTKRSETIIIVGPMKFSWASLTYALKKDDLRLIFVDGGATHRHKFAKKTPDLLKKAVTIGDGDSAKALMTIVKKSQHLSDIAFTLGRFKGRKAPQHILMVGFLGGRLDHTLFNLGEISLYLNSFSRQKAPVVQVDDEILFLGSGMHTAHIHGVFSVGSFNDNQIKLKGACEYQAKSWLKMTPLSSRGVSNVGFGEILIETKKALAIFRSKRS